MQALAGRYGLADSAVLAFAGRAPTCCAWAARPVRRPSWTPSSPASSPPCATVACPRRGWSTPPPGRPSLGARFRPARVTGRRPRECPRRWPVARWTSRGRLPTWREPVLVVRCADRPNVAVGQVPWGPEASTRTSTSSTSRPIDPLPTDRIAAAGTVVVVTRDRHRNAWMSAAAHRDPRATARRGVARDGHHRGGAARRPRGRQLRGDSGEHHGRPGGAAAPRPRAARPTGQNDGQGCGPGPRLRSHSGAGGAPTRPACSGRSTIRSCSGCCSTTAR